jgi:hypothetical protein
MNVERVRSFKVQGDPIILNSTMIKTRILILLVGNSLCFSVAMIDVRYSIVRR